MRTMIIGLLAASRMVAGCADRGYGVDRRYRSYDYNRFDPAYGGYDAGRYYRDDRRYRGNDGRYYCRRNDGTTGLIAGGVAGGLLGNLIAPGGSGLLGTVLGAAGGAAAGRDIERSNDPVRCR